MPKFNVTLQRTDTFYITVEADSEDAAVEAAYEEAPIMSAQDSGWGEKWSMDASDWEEDSVEEVDSEDEGEE